MWEIPDDLQEEDYTGDIIIDQVDPVNTIDSKKPPKEEIDESVKK